VGSMKTTTKTREEDLELTRRTIMDHAKESASSGKDGVGSGSPLPEGQTKYSPKPPIDKALTRLVKDRMHGVTRSPAGSIRYSASLLDDSRAIQFREGVRLGKPLTINTDRLCHFAKKDVSHGRLEEAQESYLKALEMDPTDGRPYLGLSRIAQRRGDLKHARGLLKKGISKSVGGRSSSGVPRRSRRRTKRRRATMMGKRQGQKE